MRDILFFTGMGNASVADGLKGAWKRLTHE